MMHQASLLTTTTYLSCMRSPKLIWWNIHLALSRIKVLASSSWVASLPGDSYSYVTRRVKYTKWTRGEAAESSALLPGCTVATWLSRCSRSITRRHSRLGSYIGAVHRRGVATISPLVSSSSSRWARLPLSVRAHSYPVQGRHTTSGMHSSGSVILADRFLYWTRYRSRPVKWLVSGMSNPCDEEGSRLWAL